MGFKNSFIKVLAASCKRFLKEEYLEREGRNDDNSSSPGINLTSNKIGYCSLCHFERRPVGVYGDSGDLSPVIFGRPINPIPIKGHGGLELDGGKGEFGGAR